MPESHSTNPSVRDPRAESSVRGSNAARPRLLFFAHRLPYPPDKGERIRAWHEIRALQDRFDVVVAALAHDDADLDAAERLRPLVDDLLVARAGGLAGKLRAASAPMTGKSCTEALFHSPALLKQLRNYARRRPVDVVLAYCSSVLPMALTVPALACCCDLVDVDSAKFRAYAQASRGPKRWLYAREARAVAKLEDLALQTCNAVFLVSDKEADQLPRRTDNVLPVGNGVDVEHFQPGQVEPSDLGPEALVFTGTMDYRPNVEGVCWFAENVWPDLHADRPAARFVIVGRNPAPAVQRLADRPGLVVTGPVPDVRPYLEAAAVSVCPLLTARGIQNKILEAMAMGLPVLATSPALEGIDAIPGEHVLRADAPADWHRRLAEFLADPARRTALGQAARELILARYTWPAQLQPLVDCCSSLTLEPNANGGT